MSGHLHTAVHEPLLGTRVSIGVRASTTSAAGAAERAAVGEFERLEAILSAYRPSSEWSRWRAGGTQPPGPELTAVLALAAHWHTVGRGAFNPLAGVLRARWLRAVDDGVAPSRDEMAALAAAIADLPYTVDDGVIARTGDCSGLDLHAIAKGWIVDRAAAQAWAVGGVTEVLVNAGGDLLHRGGHAITVGIEDPRRPFDNAPALTRVQLADGGLASSSGARRPLRVGGVPFTHVLDPRSGWPVEHTLAATTIGPDAATADVTATIVGVLAVSDALVFADDTPGLACHLLTNDGIPHASAGWPGADGATAQASAK